MLLVCPNKTIINNPIKVNIKIALYNLGLVPSSCIP